VSRLTRREAFTLLEMLIAIAITAMLVAVAVQAHLGIRRAQTHAASGVGRDRTAQILLDRLERELMGTILVVKRADEDRLGHPYLFVGRDGADEQRAADALQFVTRSPAQARFGQPAPGLTLVSYATRSGEDFGLVLLREERALPRGLETQMSLLDAEVVVDELAQFDVRYFGEGEVGWKDRWDSTSISTLDQLPVQLEILVQLYEPSGDDEMVEGPEHKRIVVLPVRPIDIEAQRSSARAPADGECVTFDDCISIFLDLLHETDEARRNEIFDLVVDVVEQCYDPASPFAEAIRSLGGDPDEKCG
jgi:prepilin-type N-terminal cleavage/methylation domain-containing protein